MKHIRLAFFVPKHILRSKHHLQLVQIVRQLQAVQPLHALPAVSIRNGTEISNCDYQHHSLNLLVKADSSERRIAVDKVYVCTKD